MTQRISYTLNSEGLRISKERKGEIERGNDIRSNKVQTE